MKTNKFQTEEQQYLNEVVEKHYQRTITLIYLLIQQCQLKVDEFCEHVDISPSTFYRYMNATIHIKEDTYIRMLAFFKIYMESRQIEYSEEIRQCIKDINIFGLL